MNYSSSRSYLKGLQQIIDSFPHGTFEDIVQCLVNAYENERFIFIMGNGGSGATASHFACDANKGSCLPFSKKLKVICLNDNVPTILAYANDLSYGDIFLEQMKNFFRPGDIVIGISGSGNSENVIKAVKYASENEGKTIGLCGYKGGELTKVTDISLIVESDDMQKIEDVHMIVAHMLMQALSSAIEKLHDSCAYSVLQIDSRARAAG